MSKKAAKAGFFGALLGALAGVFLLAPKGAKENREDLKNAAVKSKNDAEEGLKKLYRDLTARIDELKDKTKGNRGKLVDQAEAVKERIRQLISDVRDGSSDITDEMSKVLKEGQALVKTLKDEIASSSKEDK